MQRPAAVKCFPDSIDHTNYVCRRQAINYDKIRQTLTHFDSIEVRGAPDGRDDRRLGLGRPGSQGLFGQAGCTLGGPAGEPPRVVIWLLRLSRPQECHGDRRRPHRAGAEGHTPGTARRTCSRRLHKSRHPHGSDANSAGSAWESPLRSAENRLMAGPRAGRHVDARSRQTCLGWCVGTLELARCQVKSSRGCPALRGRGEVGRLRCGHRHGTDGRLLDSGRVACGQQTVS
jgi:hypothetical protein